MLAFSEEANRLLSALSSRMTLIIRMRRADVERIHSGVRQTHKIRLAATEGLGDVRRIPKPHTHAFHKLRVTSMARRQPTHLDRSIHNRCHVVGRPKKSCVKSGISRAPFLCIQSFHAPQASGLPTHKNHPDPTPASIYRIVCIPRGHARTPETGL